MTYLQKLSRVLFGLLIVVAPPLGALPVVDDHAFDNALLAPGLVPHQKAGRPTCQRENTVIVLSTASECHITEIHRNIST